MKNEAMKQRSHITGKAGMVWMTAVLLFSALFVFATAEPSLKTEPAGDAPLILYVRAKSGLSPDALDRQLLERKPRFREVPGLVQKMYGKDPATGAVCGIYFFKDQESLTAFQKSELAQSIASAYEVTEIRMETYELLYALHDDRGPITN
jgi:hypothetical protein